jgi:hypothetical protein
VVGRLDLDQTILSEMLLTSTFLRLTGNVFAWEAALHKYMDRDMARKGMLLTKDEGLKMADIIFRVRVYGCTGVRAYRCTGVSSFETHFVLIPTHSMFLE